MHKEFLMGNEAIALGALAAGVNLVCGYPGTPSSEVLETVAKRKCGDTYVEWSVNEKSAMEVAGGAAYAGARTMVTMKQMGLNVASDPLMCLAYIGVKGGMVVLVADDPGPISSQTEQDSRTFAGFAKVPCFDPSTAQEAYEMIQEAFAYSEQYQTPVFFRPTTRVCHGYASIDVKDEAEYIQNKPEGFVKDTKRWVIFPRSSFLNHQKIEKRNQELTDVFSNYARNAVLYREETQNGQSQPGAKDRRTLGVAAGGISFTYVQEVFKTTGSCRTLKVATPHPFPEKMALDFLDGLTEVLCLEELDPVIERALLQVCGKYGLHVKIYGKLTGHTACADENTRDSILEDIRAFFGIEAEQNGQASAQPPALPARPPVLCAGCPHRASFYAVKQAMKGKKTIFCGDIGCYTLGNAMPLDMVDTCLCMGAGLGIAQGVGHIEPDTSCFAFVGDSTFFASAITGVVNAVYNQAEMTLVVLDNSTTAMTGHQPHPGTGRTMMGQVVDKVDIAKVLEGIGVTAVETVNPLDLTAAVDCVKRVSALPGVKAIIFKSPCIALEKHNTNKMRIDAEKCISCKRCIRELGCPALFISDGQVKIDESLCNGCGLCSQVCPVQAIKGGADHA